MPYFFVILVFLIAAIGLSAASILAAVVPRLRPGFPFLWRVLLWSTAGFILANIPVFGLYFVPLLLERTGMTPSSGSSGSFLKLALAGGLLFGPLVASGLGFLGGAAIGVWLARRAVLRGPTSAST